MIGVKPFSVKRIGVKGIDLPWRRGRKGCRILPAHPLGKRIGVLAGLDRIVRCAIEDILSNCNTELSPDLIIFSEERRANEKDR